MMATGGAGLVVPVAGDISLMPGTGSRPAFRNVDDADRLRQRLEGQGLRTRGQKSGKLTLVMVHMRGTDLDAANLKEELQRMRLGSPLQKSKKRVGGKPRPR